MPTTPVLARKSATSARSNFVLKSFVPDSLAHAANGVGRFVSHTGLPMTLRQGRSGDGGFTAIELVMVIVLVGVLTVVAVAKLNRVDSFQVYGFVDATKAALRFAQKVAVAQRTNVVVVVNPASINLCYTSSSCASPVIDPTTGQAMALPAPAGVSVSGPGAVSFDGLGRASPGGTITVRGAEATHSLVVEQETGYVHD